MRFVCTARRCRPNCPRRAGAPSPIDGWRPRKTLKKSGKRPWRYRAKTATGLAIQPGGRRNETERNGASRNGQKRKADQEQGRFHLRIDSLVDLVARVLQVLLDKLKSASDVPIFKKGTPVHSSSLSCPSPAEEAFPSMPSEALRPPSVAHTMHRGTTLQDTTAADVSPPPSNVARVSQGPVGQ